MNGPIERGTYRRFLKAHMGASTGAVRIPTHGSLHPW